MVKITQFELENVKRIKAVNVEPQENGLTVIGGRNNQGKTSVLDAIAWALGGDKFKPSSAMREGSNVPPVLQIKLSNGLIVERRGKNSDLKVIDPSGNRAGQQLLNEFVSQFALDIPKFMESNNKKKADILLQIIGVGDQLFELEQKEEELYNKRRYIGQLADSKKKHAAEMTSYPDAPIDLISASQLIQEQQEILARNGENQRKREKVVELKREYDLLDNEISSLQAKLRELTDKRNKLSDDLRIAETNARDLQDESTAELEKSIADIDIVNSRVRANLDKMHAETEAKQYTEQYDDLTDQIDKVRKEKYDLLNSAELPLPGLSVENGELTYNGFKWDNLSGSDQLKVTTAIVRKLNPNCGFVLLDKLEQMDEDTLHEFGAWLEAEGLQAIATRVSTGGECSIIIEDGYVKTEQSKYKEWNS
ncbi:MAG: AAA family ATPase [Acutalibacteraceae bacterium]